MILDRVHFTESILQSRSNLFSGDKPVVYVNSPLEQFKLRTNQYREQTFFIEHNQINVKNSKFHVLIPGYHYDAFELHRGPWMQGGRIDVTQKVRLSDDVYQDQENQLIYRSSYFMADSTVVSLRHTYTIFMLISDFGGFALFVWFFFQHFASKINQSKFNAYQIEKLFRSSGEQKTKSSWCCKSKQEKELEQKQR